MSPRLIGGSIPADAPGAERWRERFRPLSADDRLDFELNPSAAFLVRERTERDAPVYRWRNTRRPGAQRLLVVFRSGHQLANTESPGWHALARTIEKAEHELDDCPALACGAIRDSSPKMLGPVSPMASGFVYVDAPGVATIAHWGVRLFRGFDASAIGKKWLDFFGGLQRFIDVERGFDRSRMASFPAEMLLFPKSILLDSKKAERARRIK